MNAIFRSRGLSSVSLAATLVLGCAALAGCTEEKKTQVEAGDAGAEGPQKPVLDSKLAAAVAAAESAHPAASAKGDANGPPENGVFAPGAADKAFPPGAPPKIELLGAGNAPRVHLAPAPADEQKETVSVTVRLQGGAIPVEYGLALKVDKPKDEKKAEGPKTWRVAGKVAAIAVPPQLPRDLSDKLGKLKGTELRYTIGAQGAVSDLGYTLTKEADPALGETVVKGLIDAIGVSMPPFPSDPVGVGGYWMVTDRAATIGAEVVRYRVYHVEKIDKDKATLSVDVRQYATKEDADLGALANVPKLQIVRFESTGNGKVDWTASGLLPAQGDTTQRAGFAGTVPAAAGQQPQQAVLQTEVTARFTAEGGDKKK